jgi:transposase
MRLFVGDDWAEDHHDVEVMDQAGKVLARKRLPEGAAGMAQLHSLVGGFLGQDADGADVVVGIETDRGPWVAALAAAGYLVFAVNPLQAARFRDRHQVSGAKSDAGDAHALADMVRTDSHQLRPAAGDSPQAEGVKVLARTHKTMIWERTREVQRLRHQLREYFPAALEAFADLDAPEALELLGRAPGPARAARLTRAQVSAALKRAGRRNITGRATVILAALRSEQLGQPEALTAAYAVTVQALVAVIIALNEQVKVLEQEVRDHFGRHPDAEVIVSQPGMGPVLGARVLAEFGDDPRRYADGKARRNYAGTSPVTRASGKRKAVAARFVHNDRLVDALHAQAFSALTASPGARAFYDQQRANGHGHNDALRRLANRLVGILHGCLKTRTVYDEDTAWGHRQQTQQAA